MGNVAWHRRINPLIQLALEAKLINKGYTCAAQSSKRTSMSWNWWTLPKAMWNDYDENRCWGVQFYNDSLYLYLYKSRYNSRPSWRKVGSRQGERFWRWLNGDGQPVGGDEVQVEGVESQGV